MTPTPERITADDPDLASVLTLLQRSFAFMEGRIDPPSSLGRMGLNELQKDARENEVWVLREPGAVLACMILTRKADHVYLGKLAVAAGHRGRGLSRQMIEAASKRARELALPRLQLQTRVELSENIAAFARMGFLETGRTAHAGYHRPTSVTMEREV